MEEINLDLTVPDIIPYKIDKAIPRDDNTMKPEQLDLNESNDVRDEEHTMCLSNIDNYFTHTHNFISNTYYESNICSWSHGNADHALTNESDSTDDAIRREETVDGRGWVSPSCFNTDTTETRDEPLEAAQNVTSNIKRIHYPPTRDPGNTGTGPSYTPYRTNAITIRGYTNQTYSACSLTAESTVSDFEIQLIDEDKDDDKKKDAETSKRPQVDAEKIDYSLYDETQPIGGYNNEFVDNVSNYTCAFCHLVLRDPIQIMTCGHSYCKTCWVRWYSVSKGKPTCILHNDRVDLDHVAMDKGQGRVIGSLRVFCDNKARGCDETPTLLDLTLHLRSCESRTVKCVLWCGMTMLHKTLKSHTEKECPRREVACDLCGAYVQARHMTKHDEICPMEEVTCEYCHTERIPRTHLSDHCQVTCTKFPTYCVFALLGCSKPIVREEMTAHHDSSVLTHQRMMNSAISHLFDDIGTSSGSLDSQDSSSDSQKELPVVLWSQVDRKPSDATIPWSELPGNVPETRRTPSFKGKLRALHRNSDRVNDRVETLEMENQHVREIVAKQSGLIDQLEQENNGLKYRFDIMRQKAEKALNDIDRNVDEVTSKQSSEIGDLKQDNITLRGQLEAMKKESEVKYFVLEEKIKEDKNKNIAETSDAQEIYSELCDNMDEFKHETMFVTRERLQLYEREYRRDRKKITDQEVEMTRMKEVYKTEMLTLTKTNVNLSNLCEQLMDKVSQLTTQVEDIRVNKKLLRKCPTWNRGELKEGEQNMFPCCWTVEVSKGMEDIESPSFYTPSGYKMSLVIGRNGVFKYGVTCNLMKGEQDKRLDWPWREEAWMGMSVSECVGGGDAVVGECGGKGASVDEKNGTTVGDCGRGATVGECGGMGVSEYDIHNARDLGECEVVGKGAHGRRRPTERRNTYCVFNMTFETLRDKMVVLVNIHRKK